MLHGTVKLQFLVLLLCAAASAGQSSGMWLDVPFVKQEQNGCGAATIAMVMEYWRQQPGQNLGQGPPPQQILNDLYAKEARGIYASEMESYFRQHGFRVFAFQGGWDDIEQHLGKGRPLIVALQPGSRSPRHYVVVAGANELRKRMEGSRKLDTARSSPRQRALVLALATICFLGIVLRVSNAQTSSVNSPASLEQLFQQQRWHDVVREAESQDTRSADVEYYYGTALAQ